ncbi:MAG: hypothetical protein U9Q03_00675 [Patescibacteria group bacterium]|nr:hypothetical protein [Patescibacteria group bacterium]
MKRYVIHLGLSGLRRLNSLLRVLNTVSDEKVFRHAYRVFGYVQDNLGALYIKDHQGDLEVFELPVAPKPPRLLRRKLTIEVSGEAEETLDRLTFFGGSDVRVITEQALELMEIVCGGLELFLFEDGRFKPVHLTLWVAYNEWVLTSTQETG